MMTGTTTLLTTTSAPEPELLTYTLSFESDGAVIGLESVENEDGEFGPEQAAAVYYGLSREVRDEIEAACWADAEDDGDQDAAADDARAP